MAPVSWNGSQILYRHAVRPVFLKHEAKVDEMVSNIGGKAMSAAENATREGMQHKIWFKTSLFSRMCIILYATTPNDQIII